MRDFKYRLILPFGGYHWRILDIQGNAALILTEHMIEQRKKYGERQYEVDFINQTAK